MNYWKFLQIAGIVALVIVLGFLFLVSGDQSQTQRPNVSAPSQSDGAAFNGIK